MGIIKLILVIVVFFIGASYSGAGSVFVESKGCADLVGLVNGDQNDYIVDGLEMGVICYDNKKIDRAQLDWLVRNRMLGMSAGDNDALNDMSVQIGSYMLGDSNASLRLVGRQLLEHAVSLGIDSGGRYQFLLASHYLKEFCDERKISILSLLRGSADEGNILAVAVLMYLYRGNFCIKANSSEFSAYETKFNDLLKGRELTYESVIEYLKREGVF